MSRTATLVLLLAAVVILEGQPRNPALHARIAKAVAPLGVSNSSAVATGGADINIARDQKTAIIDTSDMAASPMAVR